MSIEKAAQKKKKKPLTDQQKLNEMLEAFPFQEVKKIWDIQEIK